MLEKKYFAAANTSGGFVSYYGESFGGCSRIYVIKGGSGTGKSYFMRKCAEYVKETDSSANIEYFYCSFDPSSLDGIVINGDIAIIDGTAPHVYEPTLPGARENIVDLGIFWDEERLYSHRDEIADLTIKKRSCFARAYGYLGVCGSLDKLKGLIVSEYIDTKIIESSAAKLVSSIDNTESGNAKLRLISAIGREGRVVFDTYERIAKATHKIYDEYGIGHLFLSSVVKESERLNVSAFVSYDPLFEKRPCALLIGDIALILTDDPSDKPLSEYLGFDHLRDSEHILSLCSMQKSLVDEAVNEFRHAAEVHFSVEKIYVSSMDFKKKEKFTEEFLSKLKI